jgi:hypothetical protein
MDHCPKALFDPENYKKKDEKEEKPFFNDSINHSRDFSFHEL